MALIFQSMVNFGIEQTAALLNQGFADYIVPMKFTAASLFQSIRADGVDATVSQIVFRGGAAIGIALIARRGWSSRLAGMALVPEARGQGVGREVMAKIITDAKARGERTMVLEVIESNSAAHALYQRCGFQQLRRLMSHQHQLVESEIETTEALTNQADEVKQQLEEVDIYDVARLVTCHGLPDLPWQLSGETLSQLGTSQYAYCHDNAYILLTNPSAQRVAIRSLIVPREFRGTGRATRLLQMLQVAFPNRSWQVPALFPEEMAGLFANAGFAPNDLSQYQMVRTL